MPIDKYQTYTNGNNSLVIHEIKNNQVYYCRWIGEWQEDYDWKMKNAMACRMPVYKFKKEIKKWRLK